MRYDAEHKAQTRERMLDEAVRAIRLEGAHRVGMVEVMAKAGLTHGGFYAHFASKDDFMLAAVERMFAGAGSIFFRHAGQEASRDGLIAFVDFYLSTAHRDGREAGCVLPILSSDLPHMPAPARARFAEGLAGLTGLIAGALARIGHEDADAAASSALVEMIGAVSLSRAVGDQPQSAAILARSRSAVLTRLALIP